MEKREWNLLNERGKNSASSSILNNQRKRSKDTKVNLDYNNGSPPDPIKEITKQIKQQRELNKTKEEQTEGVKLKTKFLQKNSSNYGELQTNSKYIKSSLLSIA